MAAKPALAQVSLDDKYSLEKGRIFITGTQALVRLPMLQKQRDKLEGLNTAGFISGYRGSPLARLDQQLWQAEEHLQQNDVVFTPGINEDLGATAVWGSQQTAVFPGAKFDGVFGMWYGKGPGVDRSLDVLKHANAAGTSPHGGVLALMGDDHGCVSSTLGHQSEHAMLSAMIPVLYPASVQEFLTYGLYGWAMSRYSGAWVGMKTVTEIVESSASVNLDPAHVKITLPKDFTPPPGGLHLRVPDPPFHMEQRLQAKVDAAVAFARANKLDRLVLDSAKPRLGIITSGKSYHDVMQALQELGINEAKAKKLGLRIYKVALVWPMEPQGAQAFADGLEEILVVEEKREMMEHQLQHLLYGRKHAPRIVGKHDETGKPLLRYESDHTPGMVAQVIASRLAKFTDDKTIAQRAQRIKKAEEQSAHRTTTMQRLPYYCAGCPHNTSTQVPEGSRAVAGIGCHYMVQWMNRNSNIITHMGGEGVNWVGHAPFTNEKHVFANLGDGTYYHSGLLAIRASVSAKVNITYKILYNDAVAMTGGQPVEGGLTVPQIAHQMVSEGVVKTIVISDEPEKYNRADLPKGVTVHHRDDLPQLQKQFREIAGCSVMIYDQTCAAEKRRRRKRGIYPDPDKRVMINEAVCEGCGDCSVKSNCVAVEPVETEFGRKRQINQSACNKDFSCLKGFCPSFVTVLGGKLRTLQAGTTLSPDLFGDLPDVDVPATLSQPWNILVTGIGGTGVITIGAILGMAAHLEGKGVTVLDQTGLAQKNGAVMTHLRIGQTPDDLHAVRIATAATDLLLGCDMVVSASADSLARLSDDRTHAIVNSHMAPTAGFTLNPDTQFKEADQIAAIESAVKNDVRYVDATTLSTALLGDSIAANMFMLGYAWQLGLVPLSFAAIDQAIELNAVAVSFNKKAFAWGRLAAHDLSRVEAAAKPALPEHDQLSTTVNELITRRIDALKVYQNAKYADRYRKLVERVRTVEAEKTKGSTDLSEAVARYAYKLMAYKDEWEVARLYSDGTFRKKLQQQFEGKYKLNFHLAPPLLAPKDEQGHLKKMTFGPWVLPVFGLMARFRFLRGTALDIFGHTAERKMERKLVHDYLGMVEELMHNLSADNHQIAVALARIPEEIRGYGHVKEAHLAKAKAKEQRLLEAFRNPSVGLPETDLNTQPGLHLQAVQQGQKLKVRLHHEG